MPTNLQLKPAVDNAHVTQLSGLLVSKHTARAQVGRVWGMSLRELVQTRPSSYHASQQGSGPALQLKGAATARSVPVGLPYFLDCATSSGHPAGSASSHCRRCV